MVCFGITQLVRECKLKPKPLVKVESLGLVKNILFWVECESKVVKFGRNINSCVLFVLNIGQLKIPQILAKAVGKNLIYKLRRKVWRDRKFLSLGIKCDVERYEWEDIVEIT